ncbi:MAG TPA: protein translocase subunit SecD [Thermomicrobiales bacterium]|nr:protein translocase subunit SecD [Thermomicrobiales bacterium]
MRNRLRLTLAFIVVLTLGAVWISLPSDVLSVFGIKDDIYVHQGLDLQGGLQVLLEADPPPGQDVDRDTLEGTRNTIERRVNALGVSEPLIQTRGDNQIIVELPGIDDPEQAVRVVQQTALLEIVDTAGQPLQPGQVITTSLGGPEDVLGSGTPAASPELIEGATPVAASPAPPGGTPDLTVDAASPEASPVANVEPTPQGPVFQTIIRGSEIADAYVTQGSVGNTVVGFELEGEAEDRFYNFTRDNIGRQMAIVVDKTVISAPVINGAISGQGIIEGPDAQGVQDLVVQLKSGSLEVPLRVASSRTVGPTLGQDSLERSLVAGIIGLTTVMLFMILYYRLPGLLSVLALMIYTSLTFALFKLIPVTLTLAGIAGFILSIGMAVDANVLIFARLKEELRIGRTLRHAVEAGFDHAWPSIRDSNISTMITCAILYWFGNFTGASIITGFALTLFIGVAVSMFTAITVTRTFLRLLIGSGAAMHPRWFGVENRGHAAMAGD